MNRVKFADVVIRANTKEDKDNTEKEFYVGGEHILSSEVLIKNCGVIEGSTIGPMFYFGFKAGQVLFVSRNPHLRKAGMVTFDGICSEKTFVLESKDENVLLQRYLPFVLQSNDFWTYAEANKSGSVNYFINWSTLAKYEFDLPSITVQRELSDLLWAIENTKQAYRKLLQKTDELVKSQFIEMFGELGSNIKGWGLTTLGNCCELNPRRPRDLDSKAQYSFVAMPSVSEKGIIDSSILRPYSEVSKGFTYFAENDVLFAKITPCMENGKGGIAVGLKNGVGFGSTEFHVLRPIIGKSSPYWLYIITMFSKFRQDAEKVMTGTGGQRRVPIMYLDQYPISLPPIELQNQFEAFVRQSDKSKFELEQALKELNSTYKTIISENLG
ncbi:restriction endonuclease subunit S [Paenibacillus sp. FSL R10-2771]|uniref:restriction endonuclease subunit S n=1 Tax=Paenibacillus sp. FSL R10-2771 TaxID=2954693 RepID=UPI0030F7BDB2